jgi:hypothetical protein
VSLTVEQAAAPTGTIAAVLVAFGMAIVLIVPSFIVLYVLDQPFFLGRALRIAQGWREA